MKALGKKIWVIAERLLSETENTDGTEVNSKETVWILNTSDEEAHLVLTIYFADKIPSGPYYIAVESQRTRQLNFNDLYVPEPIPRDSDFACVIESDVPVVIQHIPSFARNVGNGLISAISYSE
ncbi:MAG: sensory rhodopsin transducer [Proteobacteria bacterium]|nr:MAG: sensory rhodopsin transducer [Pseudomonadota bacterium]